MRNERGTALLLSILATAILGAGLMTVLVLSGTERRTVLNHGAQTDAWMIAQTGLETFAANRVSLGFTSAPAAAYESTRVNITGGYADVVLQRLRPMVGNLPALYVVRSRGYATNPQLSGTPLAQRQVAQLARWGGANTSMQVLSALTSLGGITKLGTAGTLSGADVCGAGASVGGVGVPASPGYSQNTGAPVPAGSPAIAVLGANAAAAAVAVRIDWSGISAGTAVAADITIPSGSWPSFSNASYWPVIRVTGNYTLPGNGRGILIVTGSLTMAARTWDGIILVGNALTVTGNANVTGAVVTGLNAKLGQSVGVTSLGSGNRRFRYSSCNIATALSRVGGLTLLQNSWMDNWNGW